MYNRYIPEDTSYTRVEEAPPPKAAPGGSGPGKRPYGLRLQELLSGKDGLFGGQEGKGLTGLLKSLHLENIDSGDILLLLIMLYLLVEGDDLELVIALGLVLLMGLGEKE